MSKNSMRNLMSKIRGKNALLSIALILVLTASMVFMMVPAAKAVVYAPRSLGAYVATSPKTIGLGQLLTCNLMLFPAQEGPTFYTYAQTATSSGNSSFAALTQAQIVQGYVAGGFANCTVTFTRPDGSKDVFMPQDVTLANLNITYPGLTNLMGTLLFYFTPNMVGQWSMSFSFPGETYSDSGFSTLNDTVTYGAVTSSNSYFTVQSAPVNAGILNGWPFSPLPTGYWTRPISLNNREWSAISGNWEMGANSAFSQDGTDINYNAYSTAPTTPHMLWDINEQNSPIVPAYGGIVGGMWGSWSYDSKVISATGPMVWNGLVYITEANGQYFDCYNERTGAWEWRSPGAPTLILSLKPPFQTPGQSAGVENTVAAYLVQASGGTWYFYDVNGPNKPLYTIVNVPSGLNAIDWAQGSPFAYIERNYNGWNTTVPLGWGTVSIIKWSLVQCAIALNVATSYYPTGTDNSGQIQTTYNWAGGVIWTSIVPRAPGQILPGDNERYNGERFDTWGPNGTFVLMADMCPILIGFDEQTGQELYNVNMTNSIPTDIFQTGTGVDIPILYIDSATHTYDAVNPSNGVVMWVSQPIMTDSPDWQGMPAYYSYIFDMMAGTKGVFYVGAYDGSVYAYDLSNGKILWQSADIGGNTSETIYGTSVFTGYGGAGAAGELFLSQGTVYGAEPQSRFNNLVCLNETTGDTIWTLPLDGAETGASIADGIYILCSEDGTFYAIGQGQTATTVNASPQLASQGTSVLLSGSCLDMSPAQAGTPAVSDSSMAVWMDYLHLQNATSFNENTGTTSPGLMQNPPTPMGVPVTLTAVDPNNNTIVIGTVTTNSQGMYSMLWKPTTTGTYSITATFMQDGSYYSSTGTTAVGVVPATASTSTTTTTTSSGVSATTLYTAIAAVIIVIIIVAIVLALLMLRKRP